MFKNLKTSVLLVFFHQKFAMIQFFKFVYQNVKPFAHARRTSHFKPMAYY